MLTNINPIIFVFFIIGLFVISILAFIQWVREINFAAKLQMENEELAAKNLALETDQLQFQLQPHTLRNIIAGIHVASKNLYHATESLANILDYVLYHRDQHLVSVKNEIDFLRGYQELQAKFIYHDDFMEIDIDKVDITSEYYESVCIPHLITGYFIENAFKHGDIKAQSFLKVRLALAEKQFQFDVQNKCNAEQNKTEAGIGLKNLRRRLELFHHDRFKLIHEIKDSTYHASLTIHFEYEKN